MKAFCTFLSLLLCVGVFQSGKAHAAPFERWYGKGFSYSDIQESIIFAEGRFWLRRSGVALWSSSDGLSWEAKPMPGGLKTMAFGNNLFLAPVPEGTATSSDAVDWQTHRNSDPEAWIDFYYQPLVFGNGWFVSVSPPHTRDAIKIYRTRDGSAWTPVHDFGGSNGGVGSVSFANGRFFVSEWHRTNSILQQQVATSANGENWTTFSAPDIFRGIASDGAVYVGLGADLFTFVVDSELRVISRSPLESGHKAIAYGNGRFVVFGREIATSTNGIDWIKRPLPSVGPMHALVFGNGRFVAVGNNTFAVSTNGLDWQTEGLAISWITGLETVGETIVATGTKSHGGGSAVIVSTNRFEYKVHDVLPGTNIVTALAHANSQYIAAAGPKTYLSTNALEWREVDSGFLGTINAITYFDGRFWATGSNHLGDGVVLQAAVGAPWEVSHTLTGRPLIDIEASSDRIIAVGGTNYAHGYVVASEDGTNWNPGQELQFRPYSVSHFDGTFVIGGHFAGRAVSTNGIDWIQAADGQELIKPIVKAGEWFTAVYQTGSGTMMLRSKDGVSWERRSFGDAQWGTSGNIEGAVVAGNRFVVSKGNLLWETEPLVPVLRRLSRSGSRLRLEVDRWASGPFGFEASDDLQNWSTVPGLNEASLEVGTDRPWQFFRIEATSSN